MGDVGRLLPPDPEATRGLAANWANQNDNLCGPSRNRPDYFWKQPDFAETPYLPLGYLQKTIAASVT
jgi:hypothetical protein